MTEWRLPFISSQSPKQASKQSLFKGIYLRWDHLTQAERVVCLGITLIPLWWLWGWNYLLTSLGFGILAYEYLAMGKIKLKRPHPVVLFLILYSTYGLIAGLFYSFYTADASLSARDFTGTLNEIVGQAMIIWYIQSRRIWVRPSVIAWAFSIVVIFMLLLWVGIYFGLHEVSYNPPRSLFGILTRKSTTYIVGAGESNYLKPYRPEDTSIAGLARYTFFFHGPESLALVLCFINLLALDLKNRLWSFLLLVAGIFLLLLSGTRSAWLAFSFMFGLRFFLTMGKAWGAKFICTFIAIVSLVTLCLPPVTYYIWNRTTHSIVAVDKYRGDSTEVRGEIYRRTIHEISRSSVIQFTFGFVTEGEGVLPGYEPAKVGTHSMYLGTLLYRRGVIGTILFVGYWLSLFTWLYQTRRHRPLSGFLFFGVATLTFCVMALESTTMPILLIILVMGEQKSRAIPYQQLSTSL